MGSSVLVRGLNRLYVDFVMPSQVECYGKLLADILDKGYEICSIAEYWERIKGQKPLGQNTVVLRHDVDSDLPTTRMMWRVEKSLGIKSSYYFRWVTLDVSLMKEIEQAGGEASYHYEELAAFAKQKRLKQPSDVLWYMPRLRELFAKNLQMLRKMTGLPMSIVASHGDFVNRRLNLYNWQILQSESFRKDIQVDLEVYDEKFMQHVGSRHADGGVLPSFWMPNDPSQAISDKISVIYLLVHPGNWRANTIENVRNDIFRVWEGLRYSL